MLTKDLLIHRTVKGKLYPFKIKPKDIELKELAQTVLQVFQELQGEPYCRIKESLADITCSSPKVKAGLEKILLDLCQVTDLGDTLYENRWEYLRFAQKVRDEAQEMLSFEDFSRLMSSHFELSNEQLQERLYGDLPDQRPLANMPDIDSDWLCDRYNLAQVQGLVLRAKSLSVELRHVDLSFRRSLFRNLKFHQLLVENICDEDNCFSFDLTGPLGIFDMPQKYGLKFANFIPYILQAADFSIQGQIKLADKEALLQITPKDGLKSHYKQKSSYIPSDLQQCFDQFRAKYKPAKIDISSSFLNLGRQNYCFPDFYVEPTGKKDRVYIELFHRWHHGQIKSRLDLLEKNNSKDIRIGVCRSVYNRKELKPILDESPWFKKNGFLFRSSPTAKAIAQASLPN